MRDWLKNLREILRAGLWLVPAVLIIAESLLALVVLALDRTRSLEPSGDWLFGGDKQAALAIVGTIADGVLTVGGVAFSITVVALALAGSQYGALQMASYLRDRLNQFVLGTFVGTFVYCLIVLGHMDVAGGSDGVPEYAVTLAVLLGLLSLAAFIVLFHHLSQSLQAERLAARLGADLLARLHHMYPEKAERRREAADDGPADETGPWTPILARETGYLQAIEYERALAIAIQHHAVVRLSRRAGDFITAGSPIGRLWHDGAEDRAAVAAAIVRCHLIGRMRTPTQDPEYPVHQLAQIAVRALSPAINDPYTALICLDWLEAALRVLARGTIAPIACRDASGRLRIIAPHAGFAQVADAVFNKVRQAARPHRALMMRLVAMVENVAGVASRDEDRASLLMHLRQLAEDGAQGLAVERERAELRARCAAVETLLRIETEKNPSAEGADTEDI